uniref:SURF1-like protein n=2 Tax=Vibrio ziniensis TaxID=2711221 RepID=A0A6G7CPE5_9VIBR|nr:SURF1 family protein [Vibrio ziniensis]
MNSRNRTKMIFTTSGSMSDPLSRSVSTDSRSVMKRLSVKAILGAVLTVVVFAVLVKLGLWQMSRGEQKQALEQELQLRQQMEPISLGMALEQYSMTNIAGVRVKIAVTPSRNMTFLLDNQTYQGKVGYLAYQLVRESSGHGMLLEIGFVPAANDRNVLPEVNWLAEPRELEGRLYQKSLNPLSSELSIEDKTPHRIQNLNIEQLSLWVGEPILPVAFQPQETDWSYAQPWVPIPLSADKHFGYAVQWFVMATVLFFITLALCLRVYQSRRAA